MRERRYAKRIAPLVVLLMSPAMYGETGQVRPARALSEFSAAIEDLAASLSPAVVQIEVRSRALVEEGEGRNAGFVTEQRGTGSGVIVDPAGYIVTNAHVVSGARRIDVSVLTPGQPGGKKGHRHYPGKLIGIDKETDLAVLKIDATGLPTLSFMNSDTLRQGQVVLALGSPLGLDNTLTVGFISAPMRQLRPDKPMTYVQTDAPINPGNSGGPLLDIEGHIAGINTMILTQSGGSEGIGFAIPGNLVQMVYGQLRKEGHIHRGVIGVISQEITPDLAAALGLEYHSGVIIADVLPESAAEASGVKQGDIVLAIDGKPIQEGRQLMAAVFQHPPGKTIMVDIQRGKDKIQKEVMVMEKPNSPGSLADMATQEGHIVKQLGILAVTLTDRVNSLLPGLRRLTGVVVAAIPAEFAGLNPGLESGDVIYSLNNDPVNTLDDLRQALAQKKSGDPLALLVEHEGTMSYLAFELE